MKAKGILGLVLGLAVLLTGCGGPGAFKMDIPVTVVSREDGSGTRGAFVELFGIEAEDAKGQLVDETTVEAVVISSTAVMMSTVEDNPYAIGYISMGSMSDAVKALKIDGVPATAANIRDGSYKIARPFLIATGREQSAAAGDFIAYILSAGGQSVVEAAGYIPLQDAPDYAGTKPAGKVVVAGSSSVTPVMEKLKEAYLILNPAAEIEIQQSDSSTGLSSVAGGIADIGMASRQLKASERELGLVPTAIAMDGIAVIVSGETPVDDLSSEQVRRIFTGEAATWGAVLG